MAADAMACYLDGAAEVDLPVGPPVGGAVVRSVRPAFLPDRGDGTRTGSAGGPAAAHANLAREEAAWEAGLTAAAGRAA